MMSEIRERLAARWEIAKDEPTWCGVIIHVGLESAMLVVKPTTGAGRRRWILAAQVCPANVIEPSIALQYNSIAPRGALALELGTMYVLRELLDDDARLEETIDELAREAIRLRRSANEHRKSARALSHYAD